MKDLRKDLSPKAQFLTCNKDNHDYFRKSTANGKSRHVLQRTILDVRNLISSPWTGAAIRSEYSSWKQGNDYRGIYQVHPALHHLSSQLSTVLLVQPPPGQPKAPTEEPAVFSINLHADHTAVVVLQQRRPLPKDSYPAKRSSLLSLAWRAKPRSSCQTLYLARH